MSAAPVLTDRAADALVPSLITVSEDSHYVMVKTIANQLALDDDERTNIIAQREADLEEAEWILGVIRAAGYVLVPRQR